MGRHRAFEPICNHFLRLRKQSSRWKMDQAHDDAIKPGDFSI